MRRSTRTGLVAAHASCTGCPWNYESRKNALALAAKHHDRTAHVVHVELVTVVIYGAADSGSVSTSG